MNMWLGRIQKFPHKYSSYIAFFISILETVIIKGENNSNAPTAKFFNHQLHIIVLVEEEINTLIILKTITLSTHTST